jgi:hypothetical protein
MGRPTITGTDWLMAYAMVAGAIFLLVIGLALLGTWALARV